MIKFRRGFTLVEMMIVVAIIGILSAIALPAFEDYITRSQVDEAVMLAGGLKAPLAEYGSQANGWPTLLVAHGLNINSDQMGAVLVGKYSMVSSTIVGSYPIGSIVVTMGSNTRVNGGTIFFTTSDGGATWSCNGGTLPIKKRPTACQ